MEADAALIDVVVALEELVEMEGGLGQVVVEGEGVDGSFWVVLLEPEVEH